MKLKMREECMNCIFLEGTEPESCVCKKHENPTCYRKKKTCKKYEAEKQDSAPLSAVAYTDGSYNRNTGEYGYAAIMYIADKEIPMSGKGKDVHNGWQVQGEITAVLAACEKAVELGVRSLEIRYDYTGVEHWAKGQWKAVKSYTKDYVKKITNFMSILNISFVHVKAHTGEDGNTKVDILAKQACGVKIPPKTPAGYLPVIPKDVSEKCRDAILAFYAKKERTYSDYVCLKTFGPDEYSKKSFNELERYAMDRHLKISINGMDRSIYAATVRWVMRGLTLDDALYKANVDAEVFQNIKNKKR